MPQSDVTVDSRGLCSYCVRAAALEASRPFCNEPMTVKGNPEWGCTRELHHRGDHIGCFPFNSDTTLHGHFNDNDEILVGYCADCRWFAEFAELPPSCLRGLALQRGHDGVHIGCLVAGGRPRPWSSEYIEANTTGMKQVALRAELSKELENLRGTEF